MDYFKIDRFVESQKYHKLIFYNNKKNYLFKVLILGLAIIASDREFEFFSLKSCLFLTFHNKYKGKTLAI